MSAPRRPDRALRLAARLVAPLAVLVLLAASAHAQLPRNFSDLVMGARHRPITDVRLAGTAWHAMEVFGGPYLLWPAGDDASRPAHDRDAARAWLARAGGELGHAGFAPRAAAETDWRGNEVWVYELVREGAALHDARVELHWSGSAFLGLVNHVPAGLRVDATPLDADAGTRRAWLAQPADGGHVASLVAVTTRREGDLVVSTIGPWTVVDPVTVPPPIPIQGERFREWNVPAGSTFPDQIDVDAQGVVWFSQPFDNVITKFDPRTQVFTQYPTTGGTMPDGMMLDEQGNAWTGLYNVGKLGKLVTSTGQHTAYPQPYAGAELGVPTATSNGRVWVTDHTNRRISEFDPVAQAWVGSHVIPTSPSWPVEVVEDPTTQTLYTTCFSSNKIAIKPPGGAITETSTPAGGPAFGEWVGGKFYYTLWNSPRLVAYDPQNGSHTSYNYPVANEPGGPMATTPDGRVVIGTRGSVGYVLVFDPADSSFLSCRLPTTVPANMKDGLTVGPRGEVWLTETSANKIARLLVP